MLALLFDIFWTFFIIGLFNFGGGGAMISLIQDSIVTTHQWIDAATFTDILAISQTTPGPIGINCATYVGYEVMHTAGYSGAIGVAGSAVATLAVVLPSFIVFFLLMKIFNRFHNDPRFTTMMSALKPATAGLIGAAALILQLFLVLGKMQHVFCFDIFIQLAERTRIQNHAQPVICFDRLMIAAVRAHIQAFQPVIPRGTAVTLFTGQKLRRLPGMLRRNSSLHFQRFIFSAEFYHIQ